MSELRGFLAVLALTATFGSSVAGAEEVVLDGSDRAVATARFSGDGEVRLYGPFDVPSALRASDATAWLYLDDVDFHDTPASVALYVVEAPRRGRLRVDPTDEVLAIGNIVGGDPKPVQIMATIHDYELPGQPHRPRTHLGRWSRAMIAVVVREGAFDVGRIVLTDVRRPD